MTFSVLAERDLIDIYAYSLNQWGAARADAYLADLKAAVQRIADGTALSTRLEFRRDPIFRVRQGRHLIIFADQGEVLRIVRVLHEAMDLPTRLND